MEKKERRKVLNKMVHEDSVIVCADSSFAFEEMVTALRDETSNTYPAVFAKYLD